MSAFALLTRARLGMDPRPSDGAAGDLVTNGLSFSYGDVRAVDDVSITVPAGTVTALLGPSGCGKTTLLRLIAGLERPDEGAIDAGGETLSTPERVRPPEKRRIGMVFQEGALFPHLSVADNVAFGLPRGPERERDVEQALELVGLAGMGKRSPTSLSGGQRQRVALARALAPGPEVLLLDEPFANLDPALRVELRTEVASLLRTLGITSVFVTHDQEEAFVMGAQVIVMRNGRVLQSAPPSELYSRPANRWVATFVGEANVVPGQGGAEEAETIVGSVPLVEAGPATCEVLLRPEHLALDEGGAWEVEELEFYGHDTLYVLKGEHGAKLMVRASGAPRYVNGDRASVRYDGPPTVAFEA
ncbi:MAG: ABC transporter ATP-binding protein [Chloroflexota bacterium]|nr:ABC transporter ATP-binding protein [Chloroflexota bacterium]